MKALRLALCISLLLAAAGSTRREALAQNSDLPPGLDENSTVRDILEYLNKKGFPEARIGLEVPLPLGEEMWDPETMSNHYNYVKVVFSPGFRLRSAADDCHIWLRNDDVKLYYADDKEAGEIDIRDLMGAEPPYAAEFSTWLETASHDKGKGPFLHTTNPRKLKALGAWQTQFQYRGRFARGIFGVKLPGAKRGYIGEGFETASQVTFTFDDPVASGWFNAAFRRLIKLCQPRSTKPRWNR
jgi:hypothetical protein